MTNNPAATTVAIHYHAGHNLPGYLPEPNVETFETFVGAVLFQASKLRSHADGVQSWADDHDCDDIPCPTYGDYCPWQEGGAMLLLANELEDIASKDNPSDRWSAGAGELSYWITPCADDCDLESEY